MLHSCRTHSICGNLRGANSSVIRRRCLVASFRSIADGTPHYVSRRRRVLFDRRNRRQRGLDISSPLTGDTRREQIISIPEYITSLRFFAFSPSLRSKPPLMTNTREKVVPDFLSVLHATSICQYFPDADIESILSYHHPIVPTSRSTARVSGYCEMDPMYTRNVMKMVLVLGAQINPSATLLEC